ncbi:MAG: hybrid sensor histidine kinase/response regulator [Rhodobacteraceae bacterium]|nr:hybrid sensor histidine kinase/response regulator [Paracoccaceae bacterium]
MPYNLIDPSDSLERQNEKLLKITETLMRRVEQNSADAGVAYAQFERAAMLEEEVRTRTRDLERTLDLLNLSNAKLAQANAETEAARANLFNAIETVQEGFALFNAQDELVMCNSRFGKHMRDVYHLFKPGLTFSEYVDLVSKSPFLDLPAGEGPEQWADRRLRRHKDNHVVFNARMAGDRWLQVSEHRTGDGGTVVLQTDVTDMMRLERQERERLLDDQARLIRATLDHLDQGVCIFDRKNRLAGWNRRISELLSLPIGRLQIGNSFASLFKWVEKQAAFPDAATPIRVRDWVSGPQRRGALSFEITLGLDHTLAVFAQQMPDQGFVISFTDISAEKAAVRAMTQVNETLERRVMERTLELEDALAEAERANASKSRFVAAASHDLLQPLSAAKLYVSSLEAELTTPELQERLAKATNALGSVENILDALLDISKLDSGQAAVHLSDVPMNLLMGQLSDDLAPLAAQKGLKFKVVPTSAVVRSDATFLRRILQNLLSNAIRYTPRGRVLIGARRLGGALRVEVWDTGPGIPEDHQEDVFAEFHRLDALASPSEGMGLGLAIVDRACRLLNHPLHLDSHPGRGTRFTVELPLVATGGASPVSRPRGPAYTLDHAIVLLLENDADLRSAMTITLEGWGLDVFACESLDEAVALLEEVDITPDAIIADYQLNDGALGTDALQVLTDRFGEIPACIITANRGSGLSEFCSQSGVSLIYKPIDQNELRTFLSSYTPKQG